jgi:hypothetical protein
MMKPKASSIGYKTAHGCISDSKLHEEILGGADDSALRVMSANRAVTKLGLTREESEELFVVKLPPDPSSL